MGIDRRVLRTRTALYDALVRLIRQKNYAGISVEDILVEADVGRSTFYAHFRSKDELLERSLERLKAVLLEAVARQEGSNQPAGRDCSRALFQHVGEYRDIHTSLGGGHGGDVLHEALGKVLAEVLQQTLPQRPGDGVPRELAVRFMVATFAAVLRWWLDRHPEQPPEAADKLFRQLVDSGLGGILDEAGPFDDRRLAG